MKETPCESVVTLDDLGSARYRLVQPIQVVVQEWGNGVAAEWPEAGAFGSGASKEQAIQDLKTDIVELHAFLQDSPDDSLGRLPLSWKRALATAIQANTPTNEGV